MKPSYYAILPANVRYDKSLKPMEKIMYAEITALSNKDGYCSASNSYFASLYEKSNETISRWISKLEKMGYIKVVIDKNKGNFRKIYPIDKKINTIDENVNTYCQKNQDPIDKNVKHNIINSNNINKNNNTSPKNDLTEEELQKINDLSTRIISYLEENKLPVKADTKEKWVITFARLIKDNYDLEVIEEAIEFAMEDKFYSQFLVNPVKFKSNIDAIVVKKNKERKEEVYVGY